MLQIVFAEHDHGAVSTQVAVEQRLRNAARTVPCLAVADVPPVAQAAVGVLHTLRHPGAVGRRLRPVRQAVGQAHGVGLQVLRGAHIDHAVVALAGGDLGHAKAQRPVAGGGGGCHHGCFQELTGAGGGSHLQAFWTLAALPSRKARTRALASGALWAMAAIMASVIRPWSDGCSAMRGSACMSA
ncbi:hypothetical protein D3C71_1225480 [compost metagenome]